MSATTALRGNREGYALIAALWFLVLASTLSLEAAHAARRQRLTAANLAESAQARTAALAGIEHARARFTTLARLALPGEDTRASDPWAAAAGMLLDTVALGAARYTVALRDVNAQVNINRAEHAQLARLLLAMRVDARRASAVADAILDWRDPDTLRRASGAERAQYLRQSRAHLPADAPFLDTAELAHVLGIDAALLDRMMRFVTTEGSGRINVNSAPLPVLSSLPGMSDEAVAVITRRRAGGLPFANAQELMLELSPEARSLLQRDLAGFLAVALFDTREIEVTSVGWVDGSPVRIRAHALLGRGGAGAIVVRRRTE